MDGYPGPCFGSIDGCPEWCFGSIDRCPRQCLTAWRGVRGSVWQDRRVSGAVAASIDGRSRQFVAAKTGVRGNFCTDRGVWNQHERKCPFPLFPFFPAPFWSLWNHERKCPFPLVPLLLFFPALFWSLWNQKKKVCLMFVWCHRRKEMISRAKFDDHMLGLSRCSHTPPANARGRRIKAL